MTQAASVRKRREVARIEGFSDAVFAFAITLLVVSLEVPKSFEELLHMMRGFPAFAISFALLFQIWWRHYRFFRSYDLEDGTVIVLTGFLLFVVLFYVYPLKFVWALVVSQFQRDQAITIAIEQGPLLMVIYGAGVIAVFATLALLYGHAYRLRAALELTAPEVSDTRIETMRNAAIAAIGTLSVGLALLGMQRAAGLVYFGIGLSEWTLGSYRGRLRRRASFDLRERIQQ
jgi:uncharacterized membrane protein